MWSAHHVQPEGAPKKPPTKQRQGSSNRIRDRGHGVARLGPPWKEIRDTEASAEEGPVWVHEPEKKKP